MNSTDACIVSAKFLSELRAALRSASPTDELVRVFEAMKEQGIPPLTAFGTFALAYLESEGPGRDLLADMLDAFIGFCHRTGWYMPTPLEPEEQDRAWAEVKRIFAESGGESK